MNYVREILFYSLMLFTGCTPTAQAQEVDSWQAYAPDAIILNGEIEIDDFERDFLPEIKDLKVPLKTLIIMKSPGGSGAAAMRIGHYLRANSVHVRVAGPCHSACALVAVSGRTRSFTVSNAVGWHSGRFVAVSEDKAQSARSAGHTRDLAPAGKTVTGADIYNWAMDGQREIAEYLVEMLGVENGSVFHVVGILTPADSIYLFDDDEMEALGFVDLNP